MDNSNRIFLTRIRMLFEVFACTVRIFKFRIFARQIAQKQNFDWRKIKLLKEIASQHSCYISAWMTVGYVTNLGVISCHRFDAKITLSSIKIYRSKIFDRELTSVDIEVNKLAVDVDSTSLGEISGKTLTMDDDKASTERSISTAFIAVYLANGGLSKMK